MIKNVIVIYGKNKAARKYRKVSSIEKLIQWLEKNNGTGWKYINTYNNQTKEFIERIYNEKTNKVKVD